MATRRRHRHSDRVQREIAQANPLWAVDPAIRGRAPAGTAWYGSLPFDEQIEFFGGKVNVPTERWADLWREAHDTGFMVAGAQSAALLDDLRSAVTSAILTHTDGGGETLAQFRARFGEIVAKHGWDYKGSFEWRSRIIYATNLRVSHAAGRYRQMREIAWRRPWWRYRHSHSVAYPRELHLAWDGLVLRHDDPWWNTHYTPNGWGCQCYVEALSDSDLERLGIEPGTAPDDGSRIWVDKVTGERHIIPNGIDPGWDYAPGASLVDRTRDALRPQALRLPADLRDELLAILDEPPETTLWAMPPPPSTKHYAAMERRMGGIFNEHLEAVRQRIAETGAETHGMTDHELVALYSYTRPRGEWAALNNVLRDAARDGDVVPGWAVGYRRALEGALAKLPDHPPSTLHRGIVGELHAEVTGVSAGDIVDAAAFLSTSETHGFSGPVEFEVLARSGKSIRGYSAFPEEAEVLLPPRRRFRVVAVSERRRLTGGRATLIRLEETVGDLDSDVEPVAYLSDRVEVQIGEPDPETGHVETLVLTGDEAVEWAGLSEGRRALLLRMRSEFEVNRACHAAGVRSLDDLATE